MLKEEVPAIISFAFIATVFLAAYLQDTRTMRKRLARQERFVSTIADTTQNRGHAREGIE
jgi:hypothetical protein